MDKFRLTPEDAVLLVIDIQERLVSAMKYGQQVIDKTCFLLKVADVLEIPVLFTEQYPKGLGGTVPELAVEGATVFEKITFTGCTPEVTRTLEETGRKKIIVSGMETHVCVFQTVRDLLGFGYQAFVPVDGVCSRTKDNFRNGLSLMASMGAVLTNTETIFFDLMKKAGTPQFKELSKLIK